MGVSVHLCKSGLVCLCVPACYRRPGAHAVSLGVSAGMWGCLCVPSCLWLSGCPCQHEHLRVCVSDWRSLVCFATVCSCVRLGVSLCVHEEAHPGTE